MISIIPSPSSHDLISIIVPWRSSFDIDLDANLLASQVLAEMENLANDEEDVPDQTFSDRKDRVNKYYVDKGRAMPKAQAIPSSLPKLRSNQILKRCSP